jgi:hypothetical protein
VQNGLIVLFYVNLSEIGGNAYGGVLSNAYYPAAERSAAITWHAPARRSCATPRAYGCKEFWPDIRRTLRRRFVTRNGSCG